MVIDYEAVIADLEAKRAAFNASIDAAIAGIRSVLAGLAALPNTPTTPTIQTTTSVNPPMAALTPDAFFGLSLAEAAIKILQTVKKQQTTREITDALEAASYHHTSQNFINTVNTALYRRERVEGDVVRIGRNWALTEWYPGRRRVQANQSKPVSMSPDEMIDPDEDEPLADGSVD